MSKSQLRRLSAQVPEIAAIQIEVERLTKENAENYQRWIKEVVRRQEIERENDLLRAALDECRTFPRLRMPSDIANAILGPKKKK